MPKFDIGAIIFSTIAIAILSLTSITANASAINGTWHAKSLTVKINDHHAIVNGHTTNIKKTGSNHWKSIHNKEMQPCIHNKEMQPYTLNYSSGHLHFHSGMDNKTLHH